MEKQSKKILIAIIVLWFVVCTIGIVFMANKNSDSNEFWEQKIEEQAKEYLAEELTKIGKMSEGDTINTGSITYFAWDKSIEEENQSREDDEKIWPCERVRIQCSVVTNPLLPIFWEGYYVFFEKNDDGEMVIIRYSESQAEQTRSS